MRSGTHYRKVAYYHNNPLSLSHSHMIVISDQYKQFITVVTYQTQAWSLPVINVKSSTTPWIFATGN